MSSQQPHLHLGALVKHTVDKNTWTATQTELGHTPTADVEGREEINWKYGPVDITGYVDTTTFAVGVDVTVLSISIGHIVGNLKDGIVIQVNLFAVKGEIKLYLKNGKEVWVHLSLKVILDGTYEGDYKILTI